MMYYYKNLEEKWLIFREKTDQYVYVDIFN